MLFKGLSQPLIRTLHHSVAADTNVMRLSGDWGHLREEHNCKLLGTAHPQDP